MVKIKISYETPDELEEVLRLLHPVTSSYKVAKCQNGAYRRAYVEVAINRQQNGGDVKLTWRFADSGQKLKSIRAVKKC